jgi:hypothetical protein
MKTEVLSPPSPNRQHLDLFLAKITQEGLLFCSFFFFIYLFICLTPVFSSSNAGSTTDGRSVPSAHQSSGQDENVQGKLHLRHATASAGNSNPDSNSNPNPNPKPEPEPEPEL